MIKIANLLPIDAAPQAITFQHFSEVNRAKTTTIHYYIRHILSPF